MSWGTRATALLALAVLVATVAGVGAAATAADGTTAAEASVSVERTGPETLDVTVEFENGTENLSTVTLAIAGADGTAEANVSETADGDWEAELGVTDLVSASETAPLGGATVEVSADNATLGEDTADLRYASLDGTAARFEDGAVHLTPVDVRGFATTAPVPVSVGDATVNASYDAEAGALVLDADALGGLDRASLFEDRQLRVAPDEGVTATPTSVNLRAAAEAASELVASGDGVAISNPLLSVLDAGTYHLELTTESPDGQFAGPVEPTDAGVELPRAALAANVTATLSVGDADGPRLLDSWTSRYASESVDVYVNGSRFETTVDDVTEVFVATGDDVTSLAVSTENGTYMTNGTLPVDRPVLLVAGNDTVSGHTVEGQFGAGTGQDEEQGQEGTASEAPATTNGQGATNTTNSSAGGIDIAGLQYNVLTILTLVGAPVLFGILVALLVHFLIGPTGVYPKTLRAGTFLIVAGGLLGVVVDIGLGAFLLQPPTYIDYWQPALVGWVFGAAACWVPAYGLATSGAGAGGGTTTTPDPVDVTVTLVDGNGHRIREGANVVAKPTRGTGSKTTKATESGKVDLSLLPGGWQLTAAVGTQQQTDRLEVEDGRQTGEQAQLAFPRPGVTVTITDKQDGEPIPGARVTVEPDEGDTKTDDTGRNGRAGVTLPYAASSATVHVDHPKYHAASNDRTLADDGPLELNVGLGRQTGRLSVTAEVDGVATEGLPVSIGPAGDDRYRVDERQGSRRTDERGRVRASDVFVGDYVVGLDVAGSQSDLFRTRSTEVAVREDEPTKVTVQASFEWTVPQATRDRIRRLRREVDGLSEQSGRDTAFPGYYGSVVDRLLDLVEGLPQYGHLFATGEHRPDDVADALLDAAEDGISRVNTAMTTKRNVDMFAACADMPSVDPRWDGDELTHETYFDYVDADVDSDLTGRIERTRARIDDERADLTEVEPTTEMWEHARELFQETRREREPLAKAARALLVAGLLDAVEHSFDRRELRERMKRTVF
ncbi:carboxypeptidase regulatory-like domain-containing protein [Haloarchaeobius iranensis]|uniref:Carboxypeptidase regulatory-like domain-containing protein n=1 Tax=Haloarchaeobius iranensis TaxID=996166 RepID=A0A1G9UBY9_9EURY|nr:carboxypeptidase regulatory-like domain-containing protein [Haloarchaeobius iranensis]SDM57065.1 hypothetical protein SAMN05192554_10431 [Haloarchaeobius iranensis]